MIGTIFRSMYIALHDKLVSVCMYVPAFYFLHLYISNIWERKGLKSLYEVQIHCSKLSLVFKMLIMIAYTEKKFRSLSKNLKKGPMFLSLFLRKFYPIGSCDEQLISLRRSRLNKSGEASLSIVRSVGAILLQHLSSDTRR